MATSSSPLARREGPSIRINDVDFQLKRDRGLCFKCEEKFHVGHRCKTQAQKELRVLVAQENGEEDLAVIDEQFKEEETEHEKIELAWVEISDTAK